MLHQHFDEIKIENERSEKTPAPLILPTAGSMGRPCGQEHQLAPAGHVRSIVNSVRERVRACVRDASCPLWSGKMLRTLPDCSARKRGNSPCPQARRKASDLIGTWFAGEP